MIIDLPSTSSSAINKKMVEMREKGGANAQGRVLTLVIVTDEDSSEDPIAAANGASFEHPCRVIVVARGTRRGTARLDAQIRVGGDAGASEVIVLRLFGQLAEHGAAVVIPLLLPDAPVVVWWPGEAPDAPADDPIGALAQRRITDSAAVRRPIAALQTRRSTYRPGDTDLAWTRLTNWRGLLAAALDQPPHEKVTGATVAGASDSASTDLLAGWLALQLRCPVRRVKVDRAGSGLRAVTLTRRSGEINLVRPEGVTATLSVTNQSARQLTLPRRNLRDCIAEELRRLDADDVYADVLSKGLDLVAKAAARAAASTEENTAGGAGDARSAGSAGGKGGDRGRRTHGPGSGRGDEPAGQRRRRRDPAGAPDDERATLTSVAVSVPAEDPADASSAVPSQQVATKQAASTATVATATGKPAAPAKTSGTRAPADSVGTAEPSPDGTAADDGAMARARHGRPAEVVR